MKNGGVVINLKSVKIFFFFFVVVVVVVVVVAAAAVLLLSHHVSFDILHTATVSQKFQNFQKFSKNTVMPILNNVNREGPGANRKKEEERVSADEFWMS